MKGLLLLGVLVIFLSVDSFGQSDDMGAIKKLNKDWLNSIPKRDSAALSRILADDFVLIAPNGSKNNKTDNLRNLLSPNMEVNSVNIDSKEVRLLTTDVGILTAWTSFVFTSNGKTTTGRNCYQDIYMKRKNNWVAVSAHVSLLATR